MQDKIIRGDGGPTAVQSRLGYLLSGPLKSKCVRNDVASILHLTASTNEEFHLQKFWSLESMGISPQVDPPEKEFLTSYQATSITQSDDGAYTASFPWKEEHPPLPTNFNVCEKRTRATARRLHQTPDLLKCYDDIIKEQESRGFIEKIHNPKPSDHAHYTPPQPCQERVINNTYSNSFRL